VVAATPAPLAVTETGAGPRRGGGATPSALRIVVVHPDLLGTYGDAGNAIVLANRALWRGVPVELVLCPSDAPLVESGDIYCLGGGEDGPQSHAAAQLADGSLARALGRGAQVLAVCAGFQILGSTFPGSGGRATAGLGLLEIETVHRPRRRSVGEVLVRVDDADFDIPVGTELTGFENHAGVTRLTGATALGSVLVGVGNGIEEDGALEGALAPGIVGTYLHGPILARNPVLADVLLARLTGSPLAPLDDEEEQQLRNARLRATNSKGRGPALKVGWAR
jgi:CobQ-like glutamine amidotransferase family enzyme